MAIFQPSIGLINILRTLRKRPTVEPCDRTFLRRHIGHRLAGLLQTKRRTIPSLADNNTVFEKTRFRIVS